jgi:hypothetical protein
VAHPALSHPPGQRHRLQGVRLTGPEPLLEAEVTVQRRVSCRGGIQVARQRIQAGMTHAGKIVTVICENNSFRLVIGGETARVVPVSPAGKSTVTRPTRPAREGGESMTNVTLDASDAAELAEMLQFLTGWLDRDPGRLAASLDEFVGNPAYDTAQLRRPGPLHLPARRQRRRAPLRPVTEVSRPAEPQGQ